LLEAGLQELEGHDDLVAVAAEAAVEVVDDGGVDGDVEVAGGDGEAVGEGAEELVGEVVGVEDAAHAVQGYQLVLVPGCDPLREFAEDFLQLELRLRLLRGRLLRAHVEYGLFVVRLVVVGVVGCLAHVLLFLE
jgi:hypothetical protein